MSAGAKLAAAAALVLIVGGAAYWISQGRGEPALPIAEAASPKPDAPADTTAQPVAPVAPARESIAAETKAAPAETAPAPPAAPTPPKEFAVAHVRARFVDTSGQPWNNVWFREESDGSPTTNSGVDGRAELALDEFEREGEQIFRFAASRDGCATRAMRATVVPGQTLDLGEVVLERECRIRGIVHDAKGVGLAEVTVGLSPVEIGDDNAGRVRRQGSSHFDRSLVARSNARGEYDLRGAPAGKWRLWGQGEGRGYGMSAPFEVHPGDGQPGVDFEVPALQDTDSITGKVVDPTGAGVASNLTLSYELGN